MREVAQTGRILLCVCVCVCVWALTEQKQVLINPAWNELWVQN